MVISNQAKLKEILSAYETMKDCLYAWDDVDNQIDAEVEKIEQELAKPSDQIEKIDPQVVTEFAQKRDLLFKLTAREIQDNVDTLDTVITGLKATAVAGLAVPTFAAAVALSPGLATAGFFTTASLIGFLGISNIAVGLGANAVGQLLSKLIFWGSPVSGEQVKEMAVLHTIGGFTAASLGLAIGSAVAAVGAQGLFKALWAYKWKAGIPILATAITTWAVARIGSKNSVAPFIDPKEMELPSSDYNDPIYQKSLAAYMALARHFVKTNTENEAYGISPRESTTLYEHMKASKNPEIELAYTELVHETYFEKVLEKIKGDVARSIQRLRKEGREEDAMKLAQTPIPHPMDTRIPPSSLVTLYQKGTKDVPGSERQNLCWNLSSESQILPCEIGSTTLFSRSGANQKMVDPNFPIHFADHGYAEARVPELLDLRIHQRYLSPDEGISLIAGHVGNVTLVDYILPKIYQGLFLPEGACVVTTILLNIFLNSKEISSDTRIHYMQVLEKVLLQYTALFRNQLKEVQQALEPSQEKSKESNVDAEALLSKPQWMEGLGLVNISRYKNPQKTLKVEEAIALEADALQKAWDFYRKWAKENWHPQIYKNYETDLDDEKETIGLRYSDWKQIEHNLLLKGEKKKSCEKLPNKECPSRYAMAASEAYEISKADYFIKSRGIYDIWHDESGLGGAFFGWFLSDLVVMAPKTPAESVFWKNLGLKTLWVASGYFVYVNTVALARETSDPLPIDLQLPELTGLVSQRQIRELNEETIKGLKEEPITY